MRYLFSTADYPIYKNPITNKIEVYSSSSITGKKLFECDTQEEAHSFCIKRHNSIYK